MKFQLSPTALAIWTQCRYHITAKKLVKSLQHFAREICLQGYKLFMTQMRATIKSTRNLSQVSWNVYDANSRAWRADPLELHERLEIFLWLTKVATRYRIVYRNDVWLNFKAVCNIYLFLHFTYVVVAYSTPAGILGECSTIYSPPTLLKKIF